MPVRWCLCVVTLFLSFAALESRAAGFGPPFPDLTVCGDVGVVLKMADRHVFESSPKCFALCKTAGTKCEALVKKVLSCQSSAASINAQFGVKSCSEVVIAQNRVHGPGYCEGWENSCENACRGF
ncbi:MAG TPA: hypothetical protein VMR50_18205 [Myxococcota bacterium]|nr:hypothetical protein [Myxococcota bacterium]